MRSVARTVGIVVALVAAMGLFISVALAAPAGTQALAPPQADDGVPQVDDSVLQATDQPEPDNTITRIDLAANGSATWDITLRTRLSNDTDVTEYERFQERFRSNTSRYLGPFADRMTGVVAAANSSSPRAMSATDFAAETTIQEVPRRWGVVRFRFTWTGFAATEGDALVVGDIFAGGFFIDDDDVLAFDAPNGYAIESVSPTADETAAGVVEWRGREDFDDGQPSVRAVPADGSGDAGGSDGGGSGGDDESVDAVPFVVLGGIAVLVGVAYAIRTERVALDGERDAAVDDDGDDVGPAGVEDEAPTEVDDNAEASVDETSDPAAGSERSGLLTDEDRVIALLNEHDGRMKQSAIVDELGWSKSKGSRVLSGMAEAGDIEKLRIGRENLIDLADDDGSQ